MADLALPAIPGQIIVQVLRIICPSPECPTKTRIARKTAHVFDGDLHRLDRDGYLLPIRQSRLVFQFDHPTVYDATQEFHDTPPLR